MLAKNSNYLGKQVGSYNIVSCLGSGGFADVYLGEHIYLKTQSAIKMLHIQLSERALHNFLNEAKIIARLEHPHIIRVFDYGVQDGSPFLVMSYAPNGTLRQRYPGGTSLPLGLVVSYIQQAASVLDYAHQLKLIHRDVKPENMLIGQQQQLLLSDFGLALAVSSTNSQPEISMIGLGSHSRPAISMPTSGFHSQPEVSTAGTMPYMAPEQIQGKACYASDQYALGIIAYEWICGEYPFTGSFLQIASQHVLTPPPSLSARVPHLPPGVEQVIFKALAKDPSQRFASVGDFAQALQQVCQTDASTSILAYKNTSTTIDEKIIPEISLNPTEKSQQTIMPGASMERSELDRSQGNDTSLDLYALHDSAKTKIPSTPELYTSHLSSDGDYSTLQLPAQASITYNTSRLPFISRNTSNISPVSEIVQNSPNVPPTPEIVHSTPGVPLPPDTNHSTPISPAQPHKRKLHFIIRTAAIAALLIGAVSLGAIWHANTYANHSTSPNQQRSTLTQQANNNTGKGSPTGTGATPTSTIPANTGNTGTTSTMPTTTTGGTTNTPFVSSTPGSTSQPVSTPAPPPMPTSMPVTDCLQGSASNIAFTSKPNPVVPRKRSFTLTNCGGNGSQNWMADVQSSGWLSLNLSSGSINPGNSVTLQILTNVNGMDAGKYVGSITFTAGNASWVVNVDYTINSTGNSQNQGN